MVAEGVPMNEHLSRRGTVAALTLLSTSTFLGALGAPAVALWLWLLGLSSIVTALVCLTARQAPAPRTGLLLVGSFVAALLVLLAVGLLR